MHARTHARTNERTHARARRRWASSARTHARTHARSPPWPGFGKRDDAPTDRRSGDDSASSVQIRRRARSHGITYSANLEFHTCARQSLKVEASGWTVAPRKVPRARMASHCLDQPPISGCIGDQIAVQQNMHDNNELAAEYRPHLPYVIASKPRFREREQHITLTSSRHSNDAVRALQMSDTSRTQHEPPVLVPASCIA
jgi:hypothetical protein